MTGWLLGVVVLSGCGPRPSPIAEVAPGVLGLTVGGRSLAAATEEALNQATAHCAAQGRQTQVLGTEMGRSEYQIVFRCQAQTANTVPPASPAQPQGPGGMVLLRPEAAPVLGADPFQRGRVVPVAAPTPVNVGSPTAAAAPVARESAPLPAAGLLATPPSRFFALPPIAGPAALPPLR